MILVGVGVMTELRVTEKFKDQILNVALVASLFLFVFGVNKPESFRVAEPQQGAGLVLVSLTPLDQPNVKPLETLEPVANATASSAAASGQTTTVKTVSARPDQAPASSASTTDAAPVTQRRPFSQGLSLPETLNSVLSPTKVKLF